MRGRSGSSSRYCSDDWRAITAMPSNRVSASVSSAATPSAKYPCSGSLDSDWNGSTATAAAGRTGGASRLGALAARSATGAPTAVKVGA